MKRHISSIFSINNYTNNQIKSFFFNFIILKSNLLRIQTLAKVEYFQNTPPPSRLDLGHF